MEQLLRIAAVKVLSVKVNIRLSKPPRFNRNGKKLNSKPVSDQNRVEISTYETLHEFVEVDIPIKIDVTFFPHSNKRRIIRETKF